MRFQQARKAERARGGVQAREIPLPLPLAGLFVEAKTSELQGIYAGEMLNWRSDGVALETRRPFTADTTTSTALQRIPFEFGSASAYILLKSTQASIGGAILDRAFDGAATVAYISANAVIADGVGQPIRYDGTSLSIAGFELSDGYPIENIDALVAHQDRIFAWDTTGPLQFYFGDVGGVTGELTLFPLSRLGNITGNMLAAYPVTFTASNRLTDALAVFTTTGFVVAYEGLDPSDASDWRSVARVKVAPPVSRFGFTNVGSDVWMLTTSGLVSIQESLQRGRLALVSGLSRAISKEIQDRVQLGGDWQLHTAADGSMVIINHLLNNQATQFIFYTESEAWATADYPAQRWHNIGTKTEFTTLEGYRATIDLDDGANVTARWSTGWLRLPRAGGISAIQPTIIAKAPLTMKLWVLSDHDDTASDLAEAEQSVNLVADNDADPDGTIALNDLIAVDAVGEVFQLIMEVEAPWAQFVNLKALVT